MGPQLNVRGLLDLVNQILRHGAGERIATDKDHDALGVLGEIHRGLTGGVRSAYHVNDLALAGQSLGGPATIVDARTLQPVDPRCLQSPPLHSARNHQGVAGDFVAVGQFNDAVRPLRPNADRFLGRQDFYSEALGLHYPATGEVASAEPAGKPEVVLDPRPHPCLAAGSFLPNHSLVQALRPAIAAAARPAGPPPT